MATNDFIGFASSGNANIMSQADYAAAHEQLVGVQPGMASSAMANKAWRQGANMAAALGDLMSAQGYDALDDGDISKLTKNLSMAVALAIEYKATYDFKSGSICRYNGDLYIALIDNGPSSSVKAPTDVTAWAKIILTTATQSANGLMSAADKIKLDGISYSAGIWTPVVKGSINAGTITQTSFADYLKINRLVFIWARIVFKAAASNYPTGDLLVSGLPYTPMLGYKLQPLSAFGYGGVDDCFRRITKAIVSSDSMFFNVTSISGSNQYYARFVDGTPTGNEVALRTDYDSEIWLCGGYLTDE